MSIYVVIADSASMNTLAIVNLSCLVLLSLLHLVMGYLFYRFVLHAPRIRAPRDYAPRAVVVLSLRGPDPFLRDTLLSLLQQDYPNYAIRVVVDSEQDPSWAVVSEVAAKAGKIPFEYSALANRSETCGLKCSSIVQAVESMQPEDEILVLSDADVVPCRQWLSDLVEPLSQPEIGVVSGNQWFHPRHGQLGSLVRNIWHAGAIIPTVLYGNPWAGSCAMRIKDIRSTGLLEKWKQTIVDDGPICEVFRPTGKRIHFVPSLVVVNREECNVRFCFTYIRRMLTWSRIYEKTFLLTPLHALLMLGSLVVAVALVIWGTLFANSLVVSCATAGLFLFAISMLCAYLLVDSAVVKVVRGRGELINHTSFARLIKLAGLFPFAIFIYGVVIFPAMFARRIKWREVTYEVHGRWNVRKIDDRPYPHTRIDSEHAASV
jgi:cellulose synthase/poly-beta-1,6-N-acetylglucosamine synthase-like glycosyltransferase